MENFGFSRIHVPQEYYRRYERLLEGGIWAIVDVECIANEDGAKGSPFRIADLRPVQLTLDFEDYAEGRSQFHHRGMDGRLTAQRRSGTDHVYTPAEATLLARLIPFVEHNYNFIELGPRGTGKSYAFSEFSPLYSHLGREGE